VLNCEPLSVLEKTNHHKKVLFAQGFFFDHLSTIIAIKVDIFFVQAPYFISKCTYPHVQFFQFGLHTQIYQRIDSQVCHKPLHA